MTPDRATDNAQAIAGGTPAPAEEPFAPVTQIRAHEYVAEQIRRHIKLRLVDPGEALPSERELVKQFGVGRPTIQMALRLLEAEHLIEVRRGRNGGTFVRAGGDEHARYELVASILRRRAEIDELLVFRDTVEPEIAVVAVEARNQTDLKRIRAAMRALDGASGEIELMRYDTELHLALGAATHNRFLVSAAEEIRHGLNDIISMLPESEVWHNRVATEHHELVDAVGRRDAEAAAAVMRSHTAHSRQAVEAVMTAIRRRRLG